jgi:uncharacterized protein YbaR (Trm112 family)
MLSRALASGEAVRRCFCSHVVVGRDGDRCPKCRRPLPVVREQQRALIVTGHVFGPAQVAAMAPVVGMQGRLVTDGVRVLGVVDGGRR